MRVSVNGIVQGVGFRPFVFNLAKSLHITGRVSNTSSGVVVEIQADSTTLNKFLQELEHSAPPLSFIAELTTTELTPITESDFTIIHSDGSEKVSTLISPDVATCPDCIAEIFDPRNRRFGYPFTNCTNCGPRYTIIENIPYDRPFTSMRHFPMCPQCQAEYEDPTDRRFHAQPNACPSCGPRIWVTESDGHEIPTEDVMQAAAQRLAAGEIMAIKGLGGFHLVVDASNAEAVAKLRKRKGREAKPLALMVRNIETAQRLVEMTPREEQALRSIQAPIVLMRRKQTDMLAPGIAPGNDRLGIMLPYTPLHHLLLQKAPDCLVMTSANLSEEPICIDNGEALRRLENLADSFLLHDRDIYLRSDDSVLIELQGSMRPLRRSRGYAPRPQVVHQDGTPVLATGGELKNTMCLLKDRFAFMSQHIGDLENLEAYDFFNLTHTHLRRILETDPELVVHDKHPGYLSTKWALEQSLAPTLAVQHHHAHLASVMAEHGLDEPVLGIILDGTGYGDDGTIWGGEFLLGDYIEYERVGHLEPMLLPGGDSAIKAPWRIAYAYLLQSLGIDLPQEDFKFLQDRDVSIIQTMIANDFQTVKTSSMGRLFDAVAALSGGLTEIRYEAQAAIEFMQAAEGRLADQGYAASFTVTDKRLIWELKPLLRAIANDVRNGVGIGLISQRFHASLVHGLVEVGELLAQQHRVSKMVLSGGVFQNQLLFENIVPALNSTGLEVFTHEQVPTNDGGIALGQAMIGRYHLHKSTKQEND